LTSIRLVFLVVIILFAFIPARADIIFPARLELKEVNSAVFEVNFNLPIISGRRLKARPILPDVCRDLTEHEVNVTQTSYRESWEISCPPQDLYGKQIIIEGLLGTQVDVMVFINTLDGRQYSAILKPSRTSYTIPSPPSYLDLWIAACFEGIQRFLKRPDLLLVLLLISFLRFKFRVLFLGFTGYLIGHGTGQFLGQQNWLILSDYLPPILILGYALISVLDLAKGKPGRGIWREYLWIPSLIFGLLSGGAFPETLTIEGLSSGEQQAASIFLNMGIAFGVLIGYLLMTEFRRVLLIIKNENKSGIIVQRMGYFTGIICFGLLLYQASALLFVPHTLPQIPPRYFVYPVIMGFWFWRIGWENRFLISVIFMVVFAVGMIPGLVGINLPLNSAVVLGSIVLFTIPLIFRWHFSQNISIPIASLTVVIQGWSLGFFVQENLTLPIGNAIGAALVISFIFLICINFMSKRFRDAIPGRLRVAAGIAAGLIIMKLMPWDGASCTLSISSCSALLWKLASSMPCDSACCCRSPRIWSSVLAP